MTKDFEEIIKAIQEVYIQHIREQIENLINALELMEERNELDESSNNN